jgi:hypothetical protein
MPPYGFTAQRLYGPTALRLYCLRLYGLRPYIFTAQLPYGLTALRYYDPTAQQP